MHGRPACRGSCVVQTHPIMRMLGGGGHPANLLVFDKVRFGEGLDGVDAPRGVVCGDVNPPKAARAHDAAKAKVVQGACRRQGLGGCGQLSSALLDVRSRALGSRVAPCAWMARAACTAGRVLSWLSSDQTVSITQQRGRAAGAHVVSRRCADSLVIRRTRMFFSPHACKFCI